MKDISKIEEICHAALELAPEEREEFLIQACGEDAELRREVESLLAFEEEAEEFIESPPEDLAEDFFTHRTDQDIIGKSLNNYRIISLLGAGGMGEVYLAEDSKLKRKIAIKLLPKKFAENDERKGRFLREARAVSALNHPNIITVYGIEEAGELDFIVTEFIDGETVYERLSEKSFDWQEAVEIALQLTDALEAAHKIGIIHRDIKPANIMIREDGYVKVLDFGLAKMLAETSDSEVFNTTELSEKQRVMGTMNYMSPEQALGEELDERSDIFSLGVVLYEMVSGTSPFKGTSDAAIYDAILHSDPSPLSELRGDLPPALEKIIKLAIEKDRSERYQNIFDMRNDLQILKENAASDLSNGSFKDYSFSNSRVFGRKKILAPIVAAIAAILISTAGIYLYSNNFFTDQTTEVKNLDFRQITNEGGEEVFPSLSPDGKNLIYSSIKSGNWDIYLRRVSGTNTINLTKDSPADDKQAVFSPDGEQIAFRSERDGGGIFIMGATGESVKRVSDTGFMPSWSPDGKEIVYSSSDFIDPTQRFVIPISLSIVNVQSGEKRLLTKGDAVQPSWSPNGERIAFWSVSDKGATRDIKTITAKGGEPVWVTDDQFLDWNPVWSPDGNYLYFLSNRGGSMNLWRVSIDQTTGKTLREPESITIPSPYAQHIAFARNGKSFAFVQSVKSTNIVKYDFDAENEKVGETPTKLTTGARIDQNPDVSPDGEWIAFDAIRNKKEDLFIMRNDGSDVRRLTNDKFKDRSPRWSPDGKKLVAYSDRSGTYAGWIINKDGSNLKKITDLEDKETMMLFWSPDGEKLVCNIWGEFPIFLDPDNPDTAQAQKLMPAYLPSDQWIMANTISPDGKKIASGHFGEDSNVAGISIYNFETKQHKVLTDYGDVPIWLKDNRRLIFMTAEKLFLTDTETGKTKEIFSAEPNKIQIPALSPDNTSLYTSIVNREADIWIADFN